jgi:hypothetical protein
MSQTCDSRHAYLTESTQLFVLFPMFSSSHIKKWMDKFLNCFCLKLAQRKPWKRVQFLELWTCWPSSPWLMADGYGCLFISTVFTPVFAIWYFNQMWEMTVQWSVREQCTHFQNFADTAVVHGWITSKISEETRQILLLVASGQKLFECL